MCRLAVTESIRSPARIARKAPIHNIDVVHIAALAAWLSGRVSSCRTGAAAIANPVSDRSFMVPPPSTTRGRARSAYNSRQCRRGGATSSRLAGAATAATANRGCGEICPAVADAFAARAGTLSRLRRSYASRTTRVMDRTRRRRWRRRPDALGASVALPAARRAGFTPPRWRGEPRPTLAASRDRDRTRQCRWRRHRHRTQRARRSIVGPAGDWQRVGMGRAEWHRRQRESNDGG